MGDPANKTARFGIGCLILFAFPFVAAGIGITWWLSRVVWQHEATKSWVEVPADIKQVELLRRKRGKGNTSRVVTTYEYEFGGQRFTGGRVNVHEGGDNFGSFHREAYQELKRHLDQRKPFRCFVDPDRPREAMLYRRLSWEWATFFTAFATVFGSMGAGMLASGFVSARRIANGDVNDLQGNEPWQVRPDWASGRILSAGGASHAAPILAALALAWNIASLPLLLKLPEFLGSASSRWVWITLAYPTIGGLLVLATVYQMLRGRKFGESELQLAATPGVVGGQLAGVVRIPKLVRAADGFRVKLSCLERSADRDGDTHDNLLWQDERVVMDPLLDETMGTTAVPVLFAIPFEAQETSRAESKRETEWRLEIEARMPGVDYTSWFEVPVFKTADSRRGFQLDAQLAADYTAPPPSDSLFREAGIRKESLAGSGLRFVFPAARNLGSAIFVTAFLAIWSGAIWLMLQLGAPILFPIIFGLIELLIIWGALDLWFYRSVAEATGDGLTVRGGLLGIGRQRYFAAGDIRRFTSDVYMTSGTRRWTNTYVVPKSGKKRIVAKAIRSKLAQQAVIDELNNALKGGVRSS